jgi:predicted esterase
MTLLLEKFVKTNNIILSVLFCVLMASIACMNNKKDVSVTFPVVHEQSIDNEFIRSRNDTTIILKFGNNEVKIDIKYPREKPRGNILILHGWDCKNTEIVTKTSFCTSALAKNYILILPNLERCNYMSQIYPETHNNLRNFPTLTWIIDTMIPNIQTNLNLLNINQLNYITGYSTGGRGATMLAYKLPTVFSAIATISGEFDITTRPDYYLYYAYLGNFKDHQQRWENECFAFDCINYHTPTYIAHGTADSVAPLQNSNSLYDSLRLYHPKLKIIKKITENAGHNYIYWDTETTNILNFFDNL